MSEYLKRINESPVTRLLLCLAYFVMALHFHHTDLHHWAIAASAYGGFRLGVFAHTLHIALDGEEFKEVNE